jgi:hypothetical protein
MGTFSEGDDIPTTVILILDSKLFCSVLGEPMGLEEPPFPKGAIPTTVKLTLDWKFFCSGLGAPMGLEVFRRVPFDDSEIDFTLKVLSSEMDLVEVRLI